MGEPLTADEAKLYDRQIRLWGVEAQRRMRDSKVLLVGFRSLNAEVCKNLVLAGINHVSIMDNQTVELQDLGAHIFLEPQHIGKNRAEAALANIATLNPAAHLVAIEGTPASKSDDFFKQFSVICATGCDLVDLYHLNKTCRENSNFFFAADTFGQMGYFFSDLKTYSYLKKVEGEADEVVTTNFTSFEDAMAVKDWSKMKRTPLVYFGMFFLYHFKRQENRLPQPHNPEDQSKLDTLIDTILSEHNVDKSFINQEFRVSLANNAVAEVSPVCAILGGILGQEIIKVISGKEEALNNLFFFNPITGRNPGETAKIPAR